MLAFREIQAIARRLRRSGLESIEIKGADYAVRLTCEPGGASALPAAAGVAAPEPQAPPAPPEPLALTASMPGHIWLQDPLTGKALAEEQGTVAAGDLLALLQVGPICLPLRAQTGGRLAGYTVSHGQRVEYGQPVAQVITEETANESH
ncbi:hypothetical protein [Erwinia sp. Leaf53]|uniref:hypothetical protein n=1 Tax=Erwinia sp. Leaf53 TaxID=1736225 RepID=UPI0006F8A49C|nr:hypothetical protein [Erwinia sp. Leaf53]KQN56597.1 hypothetical protein ASF13_05605 [Erwinia sp. Leaf53]